MKAAFAFLILGLMTSVTHAADLPANVVAEHVTSVGFAPPERRGQYRLQILKNGTIQKIDNQDVIEKMGKLSAASITKLQTEIDGLGEVVLVKPTGPICMDAPSEDLQVRSTKGETIQLWRKGGCRESHAKNSEARYLAEGLLGLENFFNGVLR